jgi:hypothetical protein
MAVDRRQDVATVISLLPFPLDEKKPGLYPGHYRLPKVAKGDLEYLTIEGAFHYVPMVDQAPLRIPTPAGEIAKSLVSDYIEGALERDEDAWPGLFWVFGKFSSKLVLKAELNEEIQRAEAAQRNWFVRLVRLADTEWSKNPGNHYSITSVMIHAATYLGQEKEWAVDPDKLATQQCPVCMKSIHPKAIVCEFCGKIINAEEYKKHQFASSGAK